MSKIQSTANFAEPFIIPEGESVLTEYQLKMGNKIMYRTYDKHKIESVNKRRKELPKYNGSKMVQKKVVVYQDVHWDSDKFIEVKVQ